MSDNSGRTDSRKTSESRTRFYVGASILFLCLALILTQVFLNRTSVGSERFVPGTLLLWTGTLLVFLALLILATVLGRNLMKLHFERRSGQVGSRFKTKMVSTFVVLSLLPAVLLFLLAYGLINFSIEQWFSAPADQMLQYSRSLAVQYYESAERRINHYASQIAAAVGPGETSDLQAIPALEKKITRFRTLFALDGVHVYDARGRILAGSGTSVARGEGDARSAAAVSSALRGQRLFQVERVTPKDALQELIWAVCPVTDSGGSIVGAILVESFNAQSVQFQAYSVREAHEKYQELQARKGSLRFTFLLILALSTLVIVFAFSWVGMYLAKRITVPIQALAEGAAALAAGNLDYRVQCTAFDELEDLVTSFNRMTSELKENKTNIEVAQNTLRQTNVELDDRRRYIETILQAIATGVISVDGDYRIRTMNRAATLMLEVNGSPAGRPLAEVIPGPAGETLHVQLNRSAILGSVAREIELQLPGRLLHLATTVTPLRDSAEQRTGWVLVLDDVTELLRAERMAAWQEVARRMAHEIKNPLTPIQLSAERVLRRYRQVIERVNESPSGSTSWLREFEEFDNLLGECTRTIAQEADSLKRLVDEFSSFARMPVARLQETDIHSILENTLNLYNGRIQDVRITKRFAPDIPRIHLDPEQMKRVFINLFDNALEAMAENAHAKVLQILTHRNSLQQSVRIEVCDTGRGFPLEYQDSLFLPYFSTRKGGTGLGLAIVRQIISEHNGVVRAEANFPLGTKIIIDLPLAPV